MQPTKEAVTRGFFPAVMLFALAVALPGGLFAQQFEAVQPLYFTRPFGAPDPLPQVLPIGSTAANFGFTITPTTGTTTVAVGNWLSTAPTGACCVTPRGVTVTVDTGASGAAMPVGTYTGQVVFSASGVTSVTVPVTFVIAPVSGTFFDNMPGQVSFSMKPGGQPPPQVLQIRNGGAGTLSWSLTSSTFNGASWISVSATTGTAPSTITVGIVTANLPNGGITAGTYGGQLSIQTAGGASIVTVPIGLTVAANAMLQVNALSFAKPFAGANPLPQTVTIANNSTSAGISISTMTATGSSGGTSWLSASPTGACCATPRAITITPAPVITLAAGTYTGQVLADNGTQLMVIPVYLNVGAASAAFFDNAVGQLSFFLQTGATNAPPNQLVQIRGAGTGSLNWTLTPTTFDSGNWLTVSETSDTAPSQISIGIVPSSLPNAALTAGVYTANLLFQGAGSSITVPITVQVGPSFEQVNGISFTMPQTGANPLPQNITIASTGTSIGFSVSSSTATGGNWLTVSPTGACCATPRTLEVSVTAAPTMAAGTYTGEIVVYSGTTSMTVPVTLTVSSPANPFFDNLPGEMTFSMQTAAPQPPSNQVFQIRNAGAGTLNWSITPLTSDGGSWLTVSPALNGAAPSLITVGIVPGNLPNGGLTAGIFVGQLLLQMGQMSITIPVSVDVGADVFGQMNAIDFTMPHAGANPLPQVITVTSTAASLGITITASTATGGAWLTVAPSGACCATPETVTVTVNAGPTMAAGIYTGQISFYSGTLSQTVPVTLTVAAANTAFFDNVPGALSYSLLSQAQAPNPPPQNVQILNRGTGTLSWTAQTFTSDGGNWLTVSASSGTAPSLVSIGVVTQNLQNQGLVAGIFTGQVLFLSGNNSSVTVPVSVRVGGNGFAQINGISFTMPQAGANPLPQILTTTSIGVSISETISAFTANGGSWMTVAPPGTCCATPQVITVTVSAPVGLAAGTYIGEVIVNTGTSAMVIPVTLTVAAATTAFFDNVPGALSYSLVVQAQAPNPPPQNVQILNKGTGTLSWTAQAITSDSGNWLTVSATSGTAPSLVSIGVVTQNLQNQGLVAGIFTGQVLFLSGNNSSVTVPVSVRVGGNGFAQINGISFTMPQAGANPLPQILTTTSIGASIAETISGFTANGGSWMTVAPVGACCATPQVITVTVSAPVGLATGTYIGEVIVNTGTSAMVIPVTLTVAPLSTPFFDNVQGQMSFFAATAATPTSQTMQIRGFGTGELDWTLTPMTADSGNWLIPSATAGAAPSNITVGINLQNLPNQGLVAGQFTGQLLFQSSGSSVTVPVLVKLAPNVFSQAAGLSFSMAYGGSSPLSQSLNVTSTSGALGSTNTFASGNGGNWLSITPSGACCATPELITFSVNGSPGGTPVPAGIHTAQAVFNQGTFAMTVPVTLSVSGTPKLAIAKSHTGNFTAGQQNATYTVTVSDQAGPSVGTTSGTVTVTETVPAGMTLVSMAGNGWTCPSSPGNTCTRSDSIGSGGSYAPITVTVNAPTNPLTPPANQVSVTGGGSVQANASDVTLVITKCDLNQDGSTNVSDIQTIVNEALGLAPAVNDLRGNGAVTVVDVQIVVNAVLGLGCSAL